MDENRADCGCTEIAFLDPRRVRASRDDDGRLTIRVAGEAAVIEPKLVRMRPLSDPDRFISIRDRATGRECGALHELSQLDALSQELLRAELHRRYLDSSLRRVLAARNLRSAVLCVLETDRGVREVLFRDVRDSALHLGNGRILITDTTGNRYDIRDLGALDRRSQVLLMDVVGIVPPAPVEKG
jgi:hypothetical protein